MSHLKVLFLVASIVAFVSSAGVGFSSPISSIDKFQTPSGGFRSTLQEASPSAEATENALFLAELFGLWNKISKEKVTAYLQSLEHKDLETVKYAVSSYERLGLEIPNAAGLVAFVESLEDKESNLFANLVGSKGDLKSTAFALTVLESLKAKKTIDLVAPKILSILKSSVKTVADQKYFEFPKESLAQVSANYYGIVLGKIVGFDFGDVKQWGSYVISVQSSEGLFYTDSSKKISSLEATAHAVASLNALSSKQKFNWQEKINVASLVSAVRKVPNDLKAASNAHFAVALANNAAQFHIQPDYLAADSSDLRGDQIVEGTVFKPALIVATFEGLAHSGLDVQVTVSSPTSASLNGKTLKLSWNAETQEYVANQELDTTGQFGSVSFNYNVKLSVHQIGELTFEAKDTKSIGYGITVASDANLAGKEVQEGEPISIGTDLNFDVQLFTQTNDNLLAGEFQLVFSVLDSSNVVLATQTVDGKSNIKPFHFTYSLKPASKVLAGELNAVFEVKNKNGVHSKKTLAYIVNVPLVASEITFEGFTQKQAATYKLGDSVKVSFVPATFPDQKTAHPLNSKDHSGKDAASSRTFLLEVSSVGGVVLLSATGTPSTTGDKTKYSFNLPVSSTFESIGTNLVTFKYVPKQGEPIVLANYDSSIGELYDDITSLNYTVNAELYITNLQEQPKDYAKDFFYGNDITFKFQVKDALSKNVVLPGASESANVYLSLKHQQTGRARFVSSVHQPAVVYTDSQGKPQGFLIKWTVSANALRGAGFLSLVAQDADGTTVALYKEGTKKEVEYAVTIGGDIEAKHQFFSLTNPLEARESAFITDLQLFCKGKALKDAQLKAVVSVRGSSGDYEELFQLPVSNNEQGVYQTSWTSVPQSTPSGEYRIQFFREVDRLRIASETADKKGKKESETDETLKPVYEFTTEVQGGAKGTLPIRTEFLVAVLLGAAFYSVNSKKAKYTK